MLLTEKEIKRGSRKSEDDGFELSISTSKTVCIVLHEKLETEW